MRLLIVDGTNNFIRNFVIIPALDMNGTPIGGLVGFLYSLKNFVDTLRPTKIVVVWDGQGGSQKRRAIIKDYKQNRKPVHLNRNFEFEEINQEQNKLYQQQKTVGYLMNLPVTQIMVDNIEADDVIAYLCKLNSEEQKIIVSGDNDFCQLLDNKTLIYKPIQKTLFSIKDCVEKFGVHPNNFAFAKAIVGDKSDNVKGVKGFGFKKLTKLFPEFGEQQKIEPEQWFTNLSREEKKYASIIQNQEVVMTNLKAVRLDQELIGFYSIDKIHRALDRKVSYNPTKLRVEMLKDGITTFKDHNFFNYFKGIGND